MRDYPHGTTFKSPKSGFEYESEGIFHVSPDSGNVYCEFPSIAKGKSSCVYDYSADKWADVVTEKKSTPSILTEEGYSLSDLFNGKNPVLKLGVFPKPNPLNSICVKVENEREYDSLVKYMRSVNGWEYAYSQEQNSYTFDGRFTSIQYKDKWLEDEDKDRFREVNFQIPFPVFASIVGIPVAKFIIQSEDVVDLHEGDKYHRAYFDKVWKYDSCTDLRPWHAVSRKDELSCQAKAFSTKEAAEKWIKEQNKPKKITVRPESVAPVMVTRDIIRVIPKNRELHKEDLEMFPDELEEIYAAYKSLQS